MQTETQVVAVVYHQIQAVDVKSTEAYSIWKFVRFVGNLSFSYVC